MIVDSRMFEAPVNTFDNYNIVMRLRPILKGLLTFVPGLRRMLPCRTAGPNRFASHCYERWIKHLTLLSAYGMTSVPRTMAELGPGDTLGVGLAAMLCGVDTYYALDVVRYANSKRDLEVFDNLVRLFEIRAGMTTKGWPDYDSLLDGSLFPSHILTEGVLQRSLNADRISRIRDVLRNPDSGGDDVSIRYITPWNEESEPIESCLDVVISHTVLQHVVNLEQTYRSMSVWLKPGGIMSHQIDFRCMGMAKEWNGHWACAEPLWKIVTGRRPYLINRQPLSEHIRLMRKYDLRTICLMKNQRTDGIRRSQLAAPWKSLDDNDLTCSGAFVVACREPAIRFSHLNRGQVIGLHQATDDTLKE